MAVPAQTPVLINTFTNPPATAGDNYGAAIAALGSDRLLVGTSYDDTTATNAGAVYLFHTNGTLLTTFTNPNPAFDAKWGYLDNGHRFGTAVAAVGTDRIIIGAPNHTRAYLFNTNGILVTTIESPHSTNDPFGSVVEAFGSDRLLIGTPEYSADPGYVEESGAAYIYGTNGTLLAFFDNPNPEWYDLHGSSLAAFGTDRVLVGVPGGGNGGLVRLFGTNGTLLTTITNPAPVNYPSNFPYPYFGFSVAAAGTDRIFIGAPFEGPWGDFSGVVYVVNTNGTLLTTITNPTPAVGGRFGYRVAMLGNDRVIISKPQANTTGTNAGAAYVFSVNGTLLATINNPTPALDHTFGLTLAPFGSEGVIIGAPGFTATNTGSVFLFSVPSLSGAPSLTIQFTASNTIAVSWPSPSTDFMLQQNTNGVSSVNWSNVTTGIQDDGTTKAMVVNPPSSGQRFYRLFKP